ncbi:MAG: hypothetical protein KKH41_07335 [Candidatus Thermoplasmatota archaeon]|nr:hypothetical protein [Candidatus Thermoplasmatota archaeon]MBU4071344.1 hypothetical protein [Candidatus Thermoplasmatota archaeon]MBU4144620.1 hypothetical protein [Candidatus Thermoplasmatota archaeon]MBU4592380.1 hypothetical protein [Candidatus Thermoplasmatota archaeon]
MLRTISLNPPNNLHPDTYQFGPAAPAPPWAIMPRLNRFSCYLEGGVLAIEFGKFDVV